MNDTKTTFIDEAGIDALLAGGKATDAGAVNAVIDKALLGKGLELHEAALLLQADDAATTERLFDAARRIKQSIYGRRLVLFAPVYLSNYCSNNCLYCGFRRDNKSMKRRALSMDELRVEIELLERQGHKRLLMLTGEDPKRSALDYLLESIEVAYSVKTADGRGEIRRINVEIAPLSVPDFRRLKDSGIGTYVLFQESYHRDTYARMHPPGPKADYSGRLYAMDRAMEAGINDVGIGALLGLHDFRFEVLAMLAHARHLDSTFGAGPHTISVPRIESAQNAPATLAIPHPVSDHDFKRVVAILRLAVPYTGIILSTREKADMRNALFALGVSQISAGSRTNPGGYGEASANHEDEQQFALGDTRSLDEVIQSICQEGYVPSFCTGCYRLGRTGADFMDLAKPGDIKAHCDPNAVSTFVEYLLDYASPETRAIGERCIDAFMREMSESARSRTQALVAQVREGKRDVLC
jgi:2-iminoacetate synthase